MRASASRFSDPAPTGTARRDRRPAPAPRMRRTTAPPARGAAPAVRDGRRRRTELRGGEVAVQHVALQLGHVHAVGREPAQRLVQRRRHVPHPEHEAWSSGRAEPARGVCGCARHHVEPRGVVRARPRRSPPGCPGRRSPPPAPRRSPPPPGRFQLARPAAPRRRCRRTTGVSPARRRLARTWPSATACECARFRSASVAPFTPAGSARPAGTARRS